MIDWVSERVSVRERVRFVSVRSATACNCRCDRICGCGPAGSSANVGDAKRSVDVGANLADVAAAAAAADADATDGW